MNVANGKFQRDRLAVHQSRARSLKQRVIESCFETVILCVNLAACYAGGHGRLVSDGRQIKSTGFPVVGGRHGVEHIDPSDHIVEGPETETSHVLAHLFSEEEEKVDDVLGLSLEELTQRWVLGSDSNRTCIQVALAHHHTAHRHQRSRSKAEFLGAEQRSDDNVSSGLELAIGLKSNATAQIVEQQNLLR